MMVALIVILLFGSIFAFAFYVANVMVPSEKRLLQAKKWLVDWTKPHGNLYFTEVHAMETTFKWSGRSSSNHIKLWNHELHDLDLGVALDLTLDAMKKETGDTTLHYVEGEGNWYIERGDSDLEELLG